MLPHPCGGESASGHRVAGSSLVTFSNTIHVTASRIGTHTSVGRPARPAAPQPDRPDRDDQQQTRARARARARRRSRRLRPSSARVTGVVSADATYGCSTRCDGHDRRSFAKNGGSEVTSVSWFLPGVATSSGAVARRACVNAESTMYVRWPSPVHTEIVSPRLQRRQVTERAAVRGAPAEDHRVALPDPEAAYSAGGPGPSRSSAARRALHDDLVQADRRDADAPRPACRCR